MLRTDGAALLSDFGIARATEVTTMTAGPTGTPAYMAPEQILGRPVDGPDRHLLLPLCPSRLITRCSDGVMHQRSASPYSCPGPDL